jgi:hypothetical protein
MSEWISMSDEMDSGGFKLELLIKANREESEIQLLYYGSEVAHGFALTSVQQRNMVGIEPTTHCERLFDLHDDELMWLAEKLGIVVELKAEVDEEDDDEEELQD